MGRTACTEPQCMYKGALYLYLFTCFLWRNRYFIIIIIIIIITIDLSLGGSSPYTSKNNTKHSKYKYTYYQNTHTLQNPHIHTPTHYKTHTHTLPHITKQAQTITVQDTYQMKYVVVTVIFLSTTCFGQFDHRHVSSLHKKLQVKVKKSVN